MSLLLVLVILGIVAVVRRKIFRTRNSPSSQLELINNQKHENDLDYSPDIIPKDQGRRQPLSNCLYSRYSINIHRIEIYRAEPSPVSEILIVYF